MAMAIVFAIVIDSAKNSSPEMAIGSLFSAPTMLYVVLLVTRTHQAEAYEMKMEERPVKTMAVIMYVREPSGKLRAMLAEDQSSRKREQMPRMGRERRLL